jgi:hypothetical protein
MHESRSWQGVLHTTLCDKVCQWLAAGRWFSSGTPVSSTKKKWLQRYNWNFVESDFEHGNPNSINRFILPFQFDNTSINYISSYSVKNVWNQ